MVLAVDNFFSLRYSIPYYQSIIIYLSNLLLIDIGLFLVPFPKNATKNISVRVKLLMCAYSLLDNAKLSSKVVYYFTSLIALHNSSYQHYVLSDFYIFVLW